MSSAAPTDPLRESQRMSSAELHLTLLVHLLSSSAANGDRVRLDSPRRQEATFSQRALLVLAFRVVLHRVFRSVSNCGGNGLVVHAR
jgi:hypothetical protein